MQIAHPIFLLCFWTFSIIVFGIRKHDKLVLLLHCGRSSSTANAYATMFVFAFRECESGGKCHGIKGWFVSWSFVVRKRCKKRNKGEGYLSLLELFIFVKRIYPNLIFMDFRLAGTTVKGNNCTNGLKLPVGYPKIVLFQRKKVVLFLWLISQFLWSNLS